MASNPAFSVINKSPTKAQYTFPKEKRFRNLSNAGFYTDKIYDKPEVRSMRATSIGFGKKSNINASSIGVPAPNQYNKKSDFDIIQGNSRKGVTFGLGRTTCTFGEPMVVDKVSPGPLRYKIGNTLSNVKYSMVGRNVKAYRTSNLESPGPAAYGGNLANSNQIGHHTLSQFKSTGNRIIPPVGKRDPPSTNWVPGPGHYKSDKSTSNGFILSRHKNQRSISFTHEARNIFPKDKQLFPGPGQYTHYTEFK